jgi:hypothetical protein
MDKKRFHLFQPQTLDQSVKAFLLAAIVGMLLIISIVQPLDGDTWWHLRAGEVTYQQGRPLTIDVFSYTRFGEEWASHGWLTELWLYISYLISGFTGITLWISLLSMAVMVLVYFQMEGPPLYRAILILIMSFMLLPFLKARPQMTSLVFFLLTLWILRSYLAQKKDLLIWLIPIFVLWANFHGGFVSGFILLILAVIGDRLGKLIDPPGTGCLDKARLIKLLVVVVLCALAIMIHPLGYKVWTTLYHTMNVGGEGANIVEWASPDFHDPVQQLYLWLLLITLVIFALTPRKVTPSELLLFSAFTAMGYIWRRNLSFMVIYGMVIMSGYLWVLIKGLYDRFNTGLAKIIKNAFESIKGRLQQRSPMGIQILLMSVVALIFIGAEFKMYLITDSTAMVKWEKKQFPVGAKEWIQENQPEGKMMNSYNWGGYFDWYLRDYPVFLDSRADLFGNEIIYQWLDVMNAKDGWQDILNRWNVSFIVMEPDWKIAPLLPYFGWDEYYRDDQSVIFGRTIIGSGQD